MQNLFIAIDPGFDTMKVVANKHIFKFPFNVIETDERKMTDYRLRDDFLLYQEDNGATYRVGQYAREMAFDNKSDVALFYTEQRFLSSEFQVGLNTTIAMSIEKNGLNDSQHNLNIHIMVALPHAYRTAFAPTIVGAVAGTHHFSLRLGQGKTKHYHYTISETQIHTISQTIAAILGETSNDNGDINQEKYFYLSNGPTLVLDGGYYTMGMVVVSRGGSVDETKTESNTSHAIANVNQLIADEIKDKRPDINHYAIEYLMNKGEDTIRYLQDGKAVAINLQDLRTVKIHAVCSDFIGYLNHKYNNLLDLKYILVTGGTGACFFPLLSDYFQKTSLLDQEHLLLTSSTLNGQIHPIEFSITIGAYKGLQGIISG